jgi:hypothetical protein
LSNSANGHSALLRGGGARDDVASSDVALTFITRKMGKQANNCLDRWQIVAGSRKD